MNSFYKYFTIVASVALMLFVTQGCKEKYDTLKKDPTQTRIYTLDNGLKVYLTVNKKEPRIQTYFAFRVGSKNDPHETTGLSHYLEHLLFKGTQKFGTIDYEAEKPYLDRIEAEFEKYRTLTDPEERKAQYALIDSISFEASQYFIGNEYDKMMAAMGAQGSNAFTSFDMTVYTEDIPANQVEAWAKVQSDRFQNLVIRGFHTELEAVYEECNLGLSNDGGNASDTLLFALFDKHPYGEQTTIGTQEHLKNPSIINIKNHYNNFYVPNNAAICMAGDFDPDQVMAIIKKYFGDWKRNDNIKMLEFEDEEPINQHIEKEVYGLESEFVEMAWRFPAAYRSGREGLNYTEDTLYIIKNLLQNGKAGLLDKDVVRPRKVLSAAAYQYTLADYSIFFLDAEPKEGQSLQEAKDIVFEQLERVKNGDFDEAILKSILNNYKKQRIQAYDSYRNLARLQYNAFINQVSWDYIIGQTERLEKITKEDIVAFAKRNFNDNYVQVNKIQAPQRGVKKLDKPAITPIRTNRDTSSAFLRETEELINSAKPIAPVFVNFDKDMTIDKMDNGQTLYYKHNDDNDLFSLSYYFTNGSNDIKRLPYALSYVYSLGTDSLTADQINDRFYDMAASFYMSAGGNDVTLSVSGLGETMDEAVALFEHLVGNAKANEDLLMMMKQNWVKDMFNSKLSKSSNENMINVYAIYGPENPATSDLKPMEILALTSEDLLNELKDLLKHNHSIVYYGPLSKDESKGKIAELHTVADTLVDYAPSKRFYPMSSKEPMVYIAPYKANQINMYRIATYDSLAYNPDNDALVRLYDAYFGSGMSSIVFQDIREAKGLAYHASAQTYLPGREGETPFYLARIYTQNDKMIDAMNAFDEILTDMPVSDKSFDVTKTNLLQVYATKRYNGADVIWRYIALKEKGASLDYDKKFYEKLQNTTLEDVVNYQKENIKGKTFNTGILGNPAELELNKIDPSYGKIKILTTEEIFGY